MHPNHLRWRVSGRARLQPPALDIVQIHRRLGQRALANRRTCEPRTRRGDAATPASLVRCWRGWRMWTAPALPRSFCQSASRDDCTPRGRGHVLQSAAALGQPLGALRVARLCAAPTVVDRRPPPVAELVEPRHHAAKAVRQGPFLSLHGHQPRKRRIKRRLERMHGQVAVSLASSWPSAGASPCRAAHCAAPQCADCSSAPPRRRAAAFRARQCGTRCAPKWERGRVTDSGVFRPSDALWRVCADGPAAACRQLKPVRGAPHVLAHGFGGVCVRLLPRTARAPRPSSRVLVLKP